MAEKNSRKERFKSFSQHSIRTLKVVSACVFFVIFWVSISWSASPLNLKAIPLRSRAITKIPASVKIKDIQLKDGRKVMVILKSTIKPTVKMLNRYSLKVIVRKRVPQTFDLGRPEKRIKIRISGQEVYCETGISVNIPTLITVELLKDRKLVSSLKKTLSPHFGHFATFKVKKSSQFATSKQVLKIPSLKLPDLVISEFKVNSTPLYQDVNIIYSVRGKIRNQGTAPAQPPFYVGLEYYNERTHTWDHAGTVKITTVIAPGQEKIFNYQMSVSRYKVSDREFKARAMADAPYGVEFPSAHGLVREIREDNNYSSEVLIHAPWKPEITGFYKDSVIKNEDNLIIYGNELGSQKTNYGIVLEDEQGHKVQAQVLSWGNFRISVSVPEEIKTGSNFVYLAYISRDGNFIQISNRKQVLILEKKEVPWSDVVDFFNIIIAPGVSIRLHTRSGSKYQNASKLVFLSEQPLEVPKIEFSTRGGHYRYLIDDMNSDQVLADRTNCADNQLRLIVRFESRGTELKGYWQDLKRWGGWRDGGAPDIEVNSAQVDVVFQFKSLPNGSLDYRAAVWFRASINASNKVADFLMDLFRDGWENDVKKEVVQGVRRAINERGVRSQIVKGLTDLVRYKAGISRNQIITKWEFVNSGIRVTYH